MRPLTTLFVAAAALWAQAPNALLKTPEINQLCQRSVQLMEAGGVAVPDLARAAAPVIENVRQACGQLQRQPGTGQPTYTLMMNVRAYLALAEAVPKPFPFPEVARLQFAELRDGATRLDSHFRALLESKEEALRTPDPTGLARYSEANRKLARPQPGHPRVVFLGDSILENWRLNEYFPDRDFVNRGLGGQITSEMLGRMKADVLDLKPEAVVILAGTNDLTREVRLTAIEDDYVMLADLAATYKIKVVFGSVLPVNDSYKDADPAFEWTKSHPTAFIKALNDWLRSFCSQRNYTYVNFYGPLADEQGLLGKDFSDDGLHPNAKGYRLMAPLVLEAVDNALRPPPAPPSAVKPKGRKDASK